MDGQIKSIDGNRYTQMFANNSFFAEIYPMVSKKAAGLALKEVVIELRVPDKLTIDGSRE
jgi:hypothetical protein